MLNAASHRSSHLRAGVRPVRTASRQPISAETIQIPSIRRTAGQGLSEVCGNLQHKPERQEDFRTMAASACPQSGKTRTKPAQSPGTHERGRQHEDAEETIKPRGPGESFLHRTDVPFETDIGLRHQRNRYKTEKHQTGQPGEAARISAGPRRAAVPEPGPLPPASRRAGERGNTWARANCVSSKW